ncbi:MAG: 3-oxoacyl-[acyl-carrier-protein] reductase [Firmicutes bacterium]|nr:3-oxoacyl-[acyl-carrier-protein] reductase [Bacillota bacterium]
MLLTNRVAIVTGASGGLGRTIAESLAREGAAVLVHYGSRADAAEAVVARIREAGGKALAHRADITDPAQAEAVVGRAVAEFGRLDILVNNAGIKRDALLLRMKPEDWDAVLAANLKGAYACTKSAAKVMLKQRQGRIINIASVAGLVGNAGQANYSAAKAGLIGFSKAVARELASRGITVNVVAPGAIDAGMLQELPEEGREAYVRQIPLGRLGAPEDVAGAVVFLASDLGNYITGQTLAVDGGLTMQ